MTGSISSPGLGSGLDVKSIVDKLVAIEHRPIDVLANQAKGVKTRLSSFGLLKSFMGNLKDAAAQLANASLWKATSATSTNAAVATATPLAGAATPPSVGSYHLKVDALAQAQTLVSKAGVDPQAALGAGSLRIELGAWDAAGTSFTPKAGATPATITLPAEASSLADVRDRINAANAGVDATLLRDASGTRLVIKSRATGEENAVRITAAGPADGDPPPAGLAALAYDPPNTPADAGALTRAQAARNAHATINGVDISSASNTLDGAVEGLRIALLKPSDDAVDIGVAPDTGAMKKALDFEGLLATRTRALEGTVARYRDRQGQMEDQVSQYQDRMLKVYTALDTKMSTLKAQSDYVTQQLKVLARNGG